MRLKIFIEGGLVQGVFTDTNNEIEYVVVDYDTCGADDDEVSTMDDGTEFVGRIDATVPDQDGVLKAFNAILADDYKIKPDRDSNSCPHCGSTNVEAYTRDDNFDDASYIKVKCHDCGQKWEDEYSIEYTYVGYSEIE
jgi:hypothetical protein